jgi:hypothetical protein
VDSSYLGPREMPFDFRRDISSAYNRLMLSTASARDDLKIAGNHHNQKKKVNSNLIQHMSYIQALHGACGAIN